MPSATAPLTALRASGRLMRDEQDAVAPLGQDGLVGHAAGRYPPRVAWCSANARSPPGGAGRVIADHAATIGRGRRPPRGRRAGPTPGRPPRAPSTWAAPWRGSPRGRAADRRTRRRRRPRRTARRPCPSRATTTSPTAPLGWSSCCARKAPARRCDRGADRSSRSRRRTSRAGTSRRRSPRRTARSRGRRRRRAQRGAAGVELLGGGEAGAAGLADRRVHAARLVGLLAGVLRAPGDDRPAARADRERRLVEALLRTEGLRAAPRAARGPAAGLAPSAGRGPRRSPLVGDDELAPRPRARQRCRRGPSCRWRDADGAARDRLRRADASSPRRTTRRTTLRKVRGFCSVHAMTRSPRALPAITALSAIASRERTRVAPALKHEAQVAAPAREAARERGPAALRVDRRRAR